MNMIKDKSIYRYTFTKVSVKQEMRVDSDNLERLTNYFRYSITRNDVKECYVYDNEKHDYVCSFMKFK